MATLTVSNISRTTGVNITDDEVAAAGGGDVFANDGKTFFIVDNGGSSITVTFAGVAQCDQGSTHNLAVTVGASKRLMFGPFETGRYNNASGQVAVTYSAVTTVNVLATKRLA